MSDENESLEELVERLSESQINEEELEQKVLRIAEKAPIEKINEMPRLYRLELKKLFEKERNTEKAAQIKD